MDENRSDTERPAAGEDASDPPGAISDQNQEEAEVGHSGGGRGSSNQGGEGGEGRGGASGSSAPDERGGSSPGAATEGSQATGHPENAG